MRSSLSLALRSVIVLMRAGRLLSVMQSDLDIQLLLDVKYDYVKKLRQTQAEMELRGAIVVDQLTVARNYVLVNAELFGGTARHGTAIRWCYATA
jgi:Broad-minded protein